ncbi:MAG TPA: amino acid ABC transporter permease [Solirubrobacteraceae bacterium]|nr:amino acid ABC transporter permease [Solirubrobacteraceae bacterium]
MAYVMRQILVGVPVTLLLAVLAWILCGLLALPITGLVRSRLLPLRVLGDLITMFVRGVPELVALFVVFFGLQQYVSLSPLDAAIIAFGIVEAPFASEIYRASLTTVQRGQRDAADSIGLNRLQGFVHVVLPQAVRFAIPPMINLFIGMLNLSSVAAAIGVNDVIQRANFLMSASTGGLRFLATTGGICIIYLVMVAPVSYVSRLIERRMRRDLFGARAPRRLWQRSIVIRGSGAA